VAVSCIAALAHHYLFRSSISPSPTHGEAALVYELSQASVRPTCGFSPDRHCSGRWDSTEAGGDREVLELPGRHPATARSSVTYDEIESNKLGQISLSYVAELNQRNRLSCLLKSNTISVKTSTIEVPLYCYTKEHKQVDR